MGAQRGGGERVERDVAVGVDRPGVVARGVTGLSERHAREERAERAARAAERTGSEVDRREARRRRGVDEPDRDLARRCAHFVRERDELQRLVTRHRCRLAHGRDRRVRAAARVTEARSDDARTRSSGRGAARVVRRRARRDDEVRGHLRERDPRRPAVAAGSRRRCAAICAICGTCPAKEPPGCVKQTSTAGASGDQWASRTNASGVAASAGPASPAPPSPVRPPSAAGALESGVLLISGVADGALVARRHGRAAGEQQPTRACGDHDDGKDDSHGPQGSLQRPASQSSSAIFQLMQKTATNVSSGPTPAAASTRACASRSRRGHA